MKNIIIVFVLSVVLYSCKNSEKEMPVPENTLTETEAVEAKVYRGDFIYVVDKDAAVITGNNFIYGVHLDDKAKELIDKVKPAKKVETDMVPIVIKGILNPKQEGAEGWDNILTVTEIIEVSDTPSSNGINIEN